MSHLFWITGASLDTAQSLVERAEEDSNISGTFTGLHLKVNHHWDIDEPTEYVVVEEGEELGRFTDIGEAKNFAEVTYELQANQRDTSGGLG